MEARPGQSGGRSSLWGRWLARAGVAASRGRGPTASQQRPPYAASGQRPGHGGGWALLIL